MESIVKYSKSGQIILNVLIILLLVLWVPVCIDKLVNFRVFENGILRQPFPNWLGHALIYTLPVLEVSTIVLLVMGKTLRYGLFLSFFLMLIFTGYVGVALLGAWEKLPCGCGSVIKGMTWTQHFFFNLFFLFVSGLGLYLWYKLRGSNAGSEATEGGSAKRHIEKYPLTSKI